MTSKEKLRYLTNLIFIKSEETDIDLTQEESDNVVNFNKDLRKDLDRLEKYEKAKELIKKKHINVLNLLHFSRDYPKNSCLNIYNKNVAIELTQDEFDLIVEVFG